MYINILIKYCTSTVLDSRLYVKSRIKYTVFLVALRMLALMLEMFKKLNALKYFVQMQSVYVRTVLYTVLMKLLFLIKNKKLKLKTKLETGYNQFPISCK